MSVLIDGYNVIYASGKLGDLMDEGRIEQARHGLISTLARYYAHRKEQVTVVFDGRTGHYPDSSRKSFTFENIRVQFTGRNRLADDRILDTAAASAHPGEITVITSDRALAAGVRRTGAHTRESADYIGEILRKLSDMQDERNKDSVPRISYQEYMKMLKEHETESTGDDS